MVLQVMPAGIPFAAGGYRINNAIWLDGSADYLSRTFATPTNNKTYTLSCWIKFNEASAAEVLALLMVGGGNDYHYICRDTDYKFRILNVVAAVVDWQIDSNAKYRDLTAWGNFVVSIDTTASSARVWWNGVEITSFATKTEPTASDTGGIINTAATHYIGYDNKNTTYADCYLAEYIFLDGAAVTDATPFGEFDADTGEWVPKDPANLEYATYGSTVTTSGMTVTANSGGTNLSNILDGDTGTQGYNANGSTGWIKIDLGSGNAKTIEQVYIDFRQDNDGITGFKVNASNDDSAWTDLATLSPSWSSGENVTISFDNSTAYRYWRFEKTGGSASNNLNIYEIEMYEKSATSSDFGANGFWLDFEDGSDLGNDVSGNNNDFTANSMSSANQVTDVPTNSAADDEGNYATLNSLGNTFSAFANWTVSAGGLTGVHSSAASWDGLTSTIKIPDTGKWAFKGTWNSGTYGFGGVYGDGATGASDGAATWEFFTGQIKKDGSLDSTIAFANSDNFEFLVDCDAESIKVYKNGTLQTTLTSVNMDKVKYFGIWSYQSGDFDVEFDYTPTDTSYGKLHTANLPTPTVKNPDDGFALITLESGTTIEASLATARTGWGSYIDVFRREDGTAEDWDVRFSDDSGNSMHFNSNAAAGAEATLASGVNYSAWSWRVGSTYGCYTAEISHTNGSATNQAHSLGSGVKSAIAKRSDSTGDWYVSHPDMASANLRFNTQDTPTTSELVTVDGTNVTLDSTLATGTYRVIVFEQIDGFSALVGYDHNGSSDGPYVHLGGSASLVLWRNIDATNYNDFFSTLTTYTTNGNGNPTDYRYNWRGTAAGASGITIGDVTANGYKMRPSASTAFGSASGDPMLVWAWGLTPFQTQARAR